MNYCDIVKYSPSGGEKGMWSGVKRVSEFLEKMREEHPHEVKHFLKEEYIAMNGKHLNKNVAKSLVDGMYHTDEHDKRFEGELIDCEQAHELLMVAKNEEDPLFWDGYVALNAMMHDLANEHDLTPKTIANITKNFFFHDEDFSDENKVFWYFEWMIF